jgi:hypothetical protein
LAPLKVARKGWMSQWFLMRTVLRYLAKNSFAMLAPYPFIILWGLFMSGYLSGLGGIHDDFEYPFLMLAVFVQFNFLYLPLSLLHNLDALPVSRKFLCALIVLPGLVAFILGYGAGKLGIVHLDWPNQLVLYQKEDAGLYVPPYLMKNPVVRVPAEYCRIAWNGRVPTISAPWGESHSAFQAPLYKDSRIVVYSPFSTEKESSSRFVAWQISRAISAIHGITIPPEEIKARYLVDSSDGIALRDKGLTLLQDYPELQSQKPAIAHAVYPVFVVALLFLLVALYLQAFRAGITDTARKWIYYGLLSLCLALHLAQAAAMISRFARPTAASALLKILNRQLAEALPGGNATVWGFSLLLCAALYWFVQSRFERIEITGPRSRS